MAVLSAQVRTQALHAMADALLAHDSEILQANQTDMERAREAQRSQQFLDRLMLDRRA